jgi:hypothetical protein
MVGEDGEKEKKNCAIQGEQDQTVEMTETMKSYEKFQSNDVIFLSEFGRSNAPNNRIKSEEIILKAHRRTTLCFHLNFVD